jgi:hypothetical protein
MTTPFTKFSSLTIFATEVILMYTTMKTFPTWLFLMPYTQGTPSDTMSKSFYIEVHICTVNYLFRRKCLFPQCFHAKKLIPKVCHKQIWITTMNKQCKLSSIANIFYFHPALLARCQKSWYLILSDPSNHMLCCLYI